MAELSKAVLKEIKALHHKKYRLVHGLFLAEGPKVVAEFLRAGWKLRRAVATDDFNAATLPIPVYSATQQQLQSISTLEKANQIVAVFQQPATLPLSQWASMQRILVLDGIRDPGNMGTLIRLADWFGLEGVLLTEDCVEVWNPKVVQASMGSLAHVPVMAGPAAAWLRDWSHHCYGADLHGVSLRSLTPKAPWALVMGSESHGLSPAMEAALSTRFTIPRHPQGQAESLNVAAAAGIALEAFSQGIS